MKTTMFVMGAFADALKRRINESIQGTTVVEGAIALTCENGTTYENGTAWFGNGKAEADSQGLHVALAIAAAKMHLLKYACPFKPEMAGCIHRFLLKNSNGTVIGLAVVILSGDLPNLNELIDDALTEIGELSRYTHPEG
jgi:hypothetical protein